MAVYKGPVVFVHPHDEHGWLEADGTQGVHYPVGDDGHADMGRPLFWDAEAGSYRDKTDGDPSHHEAYHLNHVEFEFPGEGPITVSETEAAAVKRLLDDLRGGQA